MGDGCKGYYHGGGTNITPSSFDSIKTALAMHHFQIDSSLWVEEGGE